MKAKASIRKAAETVAGTAIGAAIAGPLGAVAGGLVASHVDSGIETARRNNLRGGEEPKSTSLKLTSDAFTEGQPIPARYTCDGADISPPLQWSGAPSGTKSFALICDDPDAPVGTWVHWVLYGLPAATSALPENFATSDTLPDGARQGITDFKRTGYGGPCPPPGKPHRYFFKLYALDADLALNPRATNQQLLKAMQDHILAEASLMGIYLRRR
jgi:Raf kinase inhibitor-like YbhB/YbcL family protein